MADIKLDVVSPMDDRLPPGNGRGRRSTLGVGTIGGRIAPPAAVLMLVAAVWEFFSPVTGQPAYLLPPLHDVVSIAFADASSSFLPSAWVTMKAVLAGFGVGAAAGFALGILIFYSRAARAGLLPVLVGTQAVPILAVAPVFIVWFGFGLAPKVLMVAMITFFPVCVTTIGGLDAVASEYVNLLRSLDAKRVQIFRYVLLQSSAPYVFAGLKNAAAISVIGALVAEWVGAREGLGPLMLEANAGLDTATVFAAILYLAAMGLLMYGLIALAERTLIPWHRAGR